eukprot:TRINITY_DN80210_c0_g1_i1.p1 TRINITY_DN80210_c0_g1~~TRINITY_DN80210_c0_g1_i1.p1  ORF type:complete len:145 (+),score=30.95 TRINITY_DN80210_c0_g1_i1:23-436(+)
MAMLSLLKRHDVLEKPRGYLSATRGTSTERDEYAANLDAMALVREHSDPDACWIIIEGRVLDVTDYLGRHPGGIASITKLAGRDATAAFKAAGHSPAAVMQCGDYDVGPLTDLGRLKRASAAAVKKKDRLKELTRYL